jgi:cation:H+ antiporter
MTSIILILFAGLFLLYIGAEGLVRGSSHLALRLGLTPLVVGLTVVAYGTSSPELVVSLKAALDENGGISVGNIVGSNICNIGFILGLSAVIRPLRIDVQVVRLQIPFMIVVSLLLFLFLLNGRLSRMEGVFLFTAIVSYTAYTIYLAHKENRPSGARGRANFSGGTQKVWWWVPALILIGLAILILGAHVFVGGAVALAQTLGIRQAVMGLTVVAVGTSLPELATTIVASARRQADIAVGNVVGSNIFNILGIMGLASIAKPIAAPGITHLDLLLMSGMSAATLPLMRTGFLLNRWEGSILVAAYLGYVYHLVS